MNYSKQIKEYRLRQQISQEALARVLDVASRTVQKWEAGESPNEMKEYLLKRKGVIK